MSDELWVSAARARAGAEISCPVAVAIAQGQRGWDFDIGPSSFYGEKPAGAVTGFGWSVMKDLSAFFELLGLSGLEFTVDEAVSRGACAVA
ncbi:MAG: hypothetical protein ACK4IT_00240 [Thioalkalivibrionaceae bacterium]